MPLLGAAVDWYWPSPTREPHLSSQDGIGGTIDYLARNITAGLVLPFIAYTVGLIFFRSVPNHTKRILLVRDMATVLIKHVRTLLIIVDVSRVDLHFSLSRHLSRLT